MMLLLPQLAWLVMIGAPRQNPKPVKATEIELEQEPLQTVAECAKGSDAVCTK
jgi:hypothetical protein